jgi:hypothetical protein
MSADTIYLLPTRKSNDERTHSFNGYSEKALAWLGRNSSMREHDDDINAADPTGNLVDARKLARHINSYWWDLYRIDANCTVVADTRGTNRYWMIRSDLDKKLNFWGK